jgi:hypothetical protein
MLVKERTNSFKHYHCVDITMVNFFAKITQKTIITN